MASWIIKTETMTLGIMVRHNNTTTNKNRNDEKRNKHKRNNDLRNDDAMI